MSEEKRMGNYIDNLLYKSYDCFFEACLGIDDVTPKVKNDEKN